MLISVLAGIFLLAFCIFFHELGHFLAGKLVGIKPKVFSIGYGKGRLKKTIGDTTYQVTAIPLGGYVQFYGDDITKKHKEIKQGDFFSVGPWKRIIVAFGGPFFSVLLGLIVIFILLLIGWQPPTNKIKIDRNMESPPAAKVLKDGDKIVEVNGSETRSFEEVLYNVVLSPSKKIDLTVERNGKTFQKSLIAKSVTEGSALRIGIKPYGTSYLLVQEDKKINDEFSLLKGDKILSANGVPVGIVDELREITNANMGKNITLELARKPSWFFDFSGEKTLKIKAPVKKVDYILLSDIRQKGEKSSPNSIDIGPWYGEHLSKFTIKGESYKSWDFFKQAVRYYLKTEKTDRLSISIEDEEFVSKVGFRQRGILGVSLSENLKSEKASLPTDFLSLITRSMNQAYLTTKGTILGLYRIFEGKLSLRQSASGPIKIFDYARQSVSAGWDVYWFLLANITIILGVMNLLPIPVLDGGHILFYLIEGIYKPLPVKVIAMSVKLGFVVLLSFGLYVISIDIWDVVIQRFY